MEDVSHMPRPPAEITLTLKLEHGMVMLDLLGEHEFQVPFTRAEVERALDDESPSRVTVDPLVSFGSTLFRALFSSERGRLLWEQLDQAARDNSAVRLRIVTNVERVQHLPWELLYDASRDDFTTLSGRVTLVRTRPDGFHREETPAPTPVLHILAVSADPDGELGADADLAALEALVAAQRDRLEIVVLRQATVSALTRALEASAFDVFVCFGDGVVLDEPSRAGGVRQALQLVPEDADDPGQLDRNDLGRMLHEAQVRLALLDGSDTEWIARSLAKHIPASIGFRETLRQPSRRVVADALFGALVAGVSLDLAVGATRQALDRAQPGSGDWCRLIFYMQPGDGSFLLTPPGADAAHSTKLSSPGSAPTPELARLRRLHEIARISLAAVEQRAALHPAASRKDVESLRERVDDLERQIAGAGGDREPGR